MAAVTSDLAKVLVPFTHEDGKPTKLDVNLNAGIMQFQGMMDENTDLPQGWPDVDIFNRSTAPITAPAMAARRRTCSMLATTS